MKKVTSSKVQHTWKDAPDLLNFHQVSNLTNISMRDLCVLIKRDSFPKPCIRGRSVWLKDDIGAFIVGQHVRKRPLKASKTGENLQKTTVCNTLHERIAVRYGNPTHFFTIQLAIAQPPSQDDIKKWNAKTAADVEKILKCLPQDVYAKALRGKYDPSNDFRHLIVAEKITASRQSIATWHLHGLLFLTKEERGIMQCRCDAITKRVKRTLSNHGFGYNLNLQEPNDKSVIGYVLKNIDQTLLCNSNII